MFAAFLKIHMNVHINKKKKQTSYLMQLYKAWLMATCSVMDHLCRLNETFPELFSVLIGYEWA